MADGNAEPAPFGTLTAVFGLFAGIATLVYVGGGAIYALRLTWYHVGDSVALVSSLPKESLIASGLAQVIFPMMLIAGAYLGYRFIAGAAVTPHPLPEFGTATSRQRVALVLLSLNIALLMIIPGMLLILETSNVEWPMYLALPLLPTTFIVLAAMHVRNGLLRRYQGNLNTLKAAAALATLYAAIGLPGYLLFGSGFSLQSVHVCGAKGAYEKSGLMVGQTSDRVYVAEVVSPLRSKQGLTRRILTIPLANIEELFEGTDAQSADCDKVV
jgi:hypothetical protein